MNSIWAISLGLSHTQFFISSLVKAHWVRFFSGRLATGKYRPAPIAFSESLNAGPDDLVRLAREFGFEDIVAKRKDHFTNQASEPGHESNTKSPGARSLWLEVTPGESF